MIATKEIFTYSTSQLIMFIEVLDRIKLTGFITLSWSVTHEEGRIMATVKYVR